MQDTESLSFLQNRSSIHSSSCCNFASSHDPCQQCSNKRTLHFNAMLKACLFPKSLAQCCSAASVIAGKLEPRHGHDTSCKHCFLAEWHLDLGCAKIAWLQATGANDHRSA